MASNEYPEQLNRLQTEQSKAIDETQVDLDKWKSFKSDYDALKKRLKTLPDQLSHDVMVPFGKMAFMPGQIVHTNEIMVLLGDNWFVDRSAKQAAQIVDRRMKTVDKNVQDLESQLKLLQPRREFTSELQGLSREAGDMLDIREEYDEEKEKQWKVKHRKHVQEYRAKIKKETKQARPAQCTPARPAQSAPARPAQGAPARTEKTDEEYWERLEQLEEIEKQRKEIYKIGTKAEKELTNYKFPVWPNSSRDTDVSSEQEHFVQSDDGTWNKLQQSNDDDTPTQNLRVNLEDIDTDSDTDLLDSDDDDGDGDDDYTDDDDDDGSQDDEVVQGKGKLITFSHTQCQTGKSSGVSDNAPCTPADIYAKFYKPKSILRKNTTEPRQKVKQKVRQTKVAFNTDSDENVPKQVVKKPLPAQTAEPLPPQTAFSGTVLEKPSPQHAIPQVAHMPAAPAQPVPNTAEPTSRPVSRFKAHL